MTQINKQTPFYIKIQENQKNYLFNNKFTSLYTDIRALSSVKEMIQSGCYLKENDTLNY